MNENLFNYVTGVVIDKLEGGYFHPDMRTNNPSKFGAYHRSGETMFGLDRHAGHSLYYSTPRKTDDVLANLKYIYNGSYTFKSPEAKEFWTIIDKADARHKWAWLYRGGDKYQQLRNLASKILYPQFTYLENKYLSEKSKEIVESDPRILFHFIYAVWNGSGWFKKFAEKFNSAVASGVTNKDKLFDVAMNSRTQSGSDLIAKGGNKIKAFISDFKVPANIQSNSSSSSSGSSGSLINGILLGVFFVSCWIAYRKYINQSI